MAGPKKIQQDLGGLRMDFYQDLSKYYEDVFPVSTDKLNLVKSYLPIEHSMLEVGCSTGELTIALARAGHHVTGIDLNNEMINKAQKQADTSGFSIPFIHGDMRDLKKLVDRTYDGIICFGNTIVHLTEKQEIDQFFQDVFDLLHEKGVFLFQIVNYDRILSRHIKELPVIKNKEKGLTFYRHYVYDYASKLIHFNTMLLMQEGLELKHSIKLYPLRLHEINDLLKKIGFPRIEIFSDFKFSQFSLYDSKALIGVVQKS